MHGQSERATDDPPGAPRDLAERPTSFRPLIRDRNQTFIKPALRPCAAAAAAGGAPRWRKIRSQPRSSRQPLGLLAWAARGKDPGFSPAAILEHAARSPRYSAAEHRRLDFEGEPPDVTELSQRWHAALESARAVVGLLPAREACHAVMMREGGLFRDDMQALLEALLQDRLANQAGRIGGALSRVLPTR
jgi:hypothetical protein